MKKAIVFLATLIFITGCIRVYSSHDKLRDYLKDYCDDLECENEGIVAEMEITDVGSYAIAKISYDGNEELIFACRHSPGGQSPTGSGELGPVFLEDSYYLFDNLDSWFGHGYNYYVYMGYGLLESVEYNGVKLDKEVFEFYLNGDKKIITSFVLKLDSTELFDKLNLVLK
ncbi:hypothetical protein EDD63_12615 [Breznakia blatticola]|uniref:Lipoprotein n=1 Tax=Breznakia blatticola TaxID=1754012 RepID=A0A4R7ZII8_9FIRM|nr:hypothetical protein [Breznakia blatticola]TDW16251.1 hypothetical protein EDD63_12615 [Breznakia blatticola]